MRIRFSGYGGQGIGLAGLVFGYAAILAGKNALQTQSYGSEARGGASKSDVQVSNGEINEFELFEIDTLVVMSQIALERFAPGLTDGGLLIYDEGLVALPRGVKNSCSIPATRIAEETLERKMVANMVMVGYTAKILDLFDPQYLFESLKEQVNPRFFDLNGKALQAGLDYGG